MPLKDVDKRLDEFWIFHTANPELYELFKRFSTEAMRAGLTKFSARAVFHRIRWFTRIETTDEGFKINDRWSPYYARLLMTDDITFEDFFELRRTDS